MKQRSLWRDARLPYLVLLAVMLALHAQWTLGTGDDPMYATMLEKYSLWDFSLWHYSTWSARTLVEAVLCIVESWPTWIWRLADPVLITLDAWLAARLLNAHRSARVGWMAAGLLLCYDWAQLSSAGWVCTTLVFVWPLTAALAAAQPLARALRGESIPWWSAAGSLLLMLYAANMEQVMVVAGVCLAGLLVWHAAARRRPHWLVWAQLAVVEANGVYALTCPGTAARAAGEATSWFIDFGMRGFFQNAELGISNALSGVIYAREMTFFLMCAALCCGIWARYRCWAARLMGLFPVAAVLVLGVLGQPLTQLFPKLSFFKNGLTVKGTVTVVTAWEWKRYLPFLFLCAVFAVCIVNLYLALGHSARAWAAGTALCGGFASRAMLGFSPTVWQSGDRTAFFFLMACLFVTLCVWQSLEDTKRRFQRSLAVLVVLCAAGTALSLIGA